MSIPLRWMTWFYLFLCASAILDVILLISSSDYRNLLGVVDKHHLAPQILRYAPPIALISYYVILFVSLRKGGLTPYRMMLAHSAVYTALGLALLLPWIGILLAPVTPIGAPYLLFTVWVDNGYYAALVLTTLFVVSNIYLLFSRRRIAAALGV